MAIAGCDFVCNNPDCNYTGTGVTFASIWPLGDISLVIEAGKDKKEYYEGMSKLKNEGRKYACIAMPNKNNVPVLGYRIQKWCNTCKSLQLFDAIITSPEQTKDETINEANITCNCPSCNSQLKTFTEILDDGMSCLSCKKTLKMEKWFVNEKE